MEMDEKFVLDVVRSIVNNPNDVKTTRTIDERGVLISLDVNPADMGYVIGREGQTARSLRTLLKIVGAKNNARVNMKINEPVGGRGPNPRPAEAQMMSTDTSAVDDLVI
ncbi:MAG: KH domain-containing protein [Patescibacteria group bacterium]